MHDSDPISLMEPYRDAHGITRWRAAEPLPKAPARVAQPRKRDARPPRLRVAVETCSCGCLLEHADELCPSCGLPWAERNAVASSWQRKWWAA